MTTLPVIFIPLISALIGWVTNVVAIKMIFRPLSPVRVPFLGLTIQGVIPKRREEIARNIGLVVEEHLLSTDDIVAHMLTPETQDRAVAMMTVLLRDRVERAMPGLIPAFLARSLGKVAENLVRDEAPGFIDRLKDELGGSLRREFRFSEIVERKLLEFPLADLEALILSLVTRELRAIELLGGVLGFLIGLAQVLIILV